ncbi:hypothetical protein ACGFIW_01690 [Micromonospora sp. NPDC048935]|uniref:hypothetical protein n=1 Tax=Micromonospora sp. NPDC048935 TaxID=3364262 RepID=UPI00371664F2
MTVVTWLGCDLVTGQIVEELPGLQPSGSIGSLLGAYTSASFALPIPLAGHGAPPRGWEAATEPGRSMIVAVLGGVPIWAGVLLPREGGTEATAPLSCMSLEGYLDRRFVGDHVWAQQDEASVIAAGLISDANVEGINLLVDAPPTGTLRDRTYVDQDDATVYSRLRELSGVIDGPEWTIVLGWSDSTQTAITKTVRVRKRIGVASTTPNAVFSTVGTSNARYRYREDYGAGRGANHIVATSTSSGDGETRPQSAPARDEALLAAGWPRYEHRFTAGSSITEVATLDAHAQQALALMARGARTLTISARADADPLLGTDWSIGDDIRYELTGHRHPAGLVGVARAVGWDLDVRAGVVSPILLAAGEGVR